MDAGTSCDITGGMGGLELGGGEEARLSLKKYHHFFGCLKHYPHIVRFESGGAIIARRTTRYGSPKRMCPAVLIVFVGTGDLHSSQVLCWLPRIGVCQADTMFIGVYEN